MAPSTLRSATLALFGAACLAGPASADWTAYGGNPEHQLITSEKVTAPLGVHWKHATNIHTPNPGNRGGPIIVGDSVIFPSRNRVFCVDNTTGEVKWKAPAEADPNDTKIPIISATPTTNGEFVYVPDVEGNVTAYTLEDGTPAWSFRTGSAVRSSPSLVGNVLYFGSDDDFLYAVDSKSGNLLWKSNDRAKPFRLTDDVVGSPTYYNGVIYVNSSDMKLWAFQAETGKLIWQQRMTAPSMDISPVALNGRIYLAAGSTMYQFRLRGGAYRPFPLQQWVENDFTCTPIITEKAWYVGDRNGYFQGFTSAGRPLLAESGDRWKVKLEGRPQGAPVMTADTIYVTTDKGFIYGLDIAKGKITWTYRTEAPKGLENPLLYYAIRAPLAVSDGKLYVLGDDGTLTCMATDAADDEGPVVTTPRPTRGAVMNGAPPLSMQVYLWDEGTGINRDTIELSLDGQIIEPFIQEPGTVSPLEKPGWTYDPLKRILAYKTARTKEGQPEIPLANGRHKVSVQAGDWKGNITALEWSFVVDNSLPRGAVASTKPKNPRGGAGAAGGPGGAGGEFGSGGYPGGPGGGGGYPGGPGGMGQGQGGQGTLGRGGRYGGYSYGNRGGGGYNRGGGMGGRGGMGGGMGGGGNSGGNSGGGRGGRGGF